MMSRACQVISVLLLLLLPVGCAQPASSSAPDEGVIIIDDKKVQHDFDRGVKALFEETPEPTSREELVKQLERSACSLELPPVGTTVLSPEEVYRKTLNSVAVVGLVHSCGSKKCKRNHTSLTSGVVIREDGVVATNYHVVNAKRTNPKAMAVMTYDRKIFFVDEVLAADETNDVALLKLKGASGLTAAPIFKDEPIGRPVTVISHPRSMFFMLGQGHVARYSKQGGRWIMNITADYARGSSGGPIFNNRGDVIGLVSSTLSLAAQNAPLSVDEETNALSLANGKKEVAKVEGKPMLLNMNHQMTIKTSVPSRAILNLIGQTEHDDPPDASENE